MPRTPEQVYSELLVLRCQGGDRGAAGELYALWAPRLTRHAGRLLADPDKGAEAAQEAWVSIVGGIGSLADPARFPSWAYRIVTNRCADAIRRAGRERRAVERAGRESSVNQPTSPSDTQSDDLDRLRIAIRSLDDDHRVVVELFYLEGLGVAEIGRALGVPSGTVKSRLFNARRRLRDALEGDMS
ncbi:MAG: RNA polymerase sigma factor [Phycisphaerales bacterium]